MNYKIMRWELFTLYTRFFSVRQEIFSRGVGKLKNDETRDFCVIDEIFSVRQEIFSRRGVPK